MTATNLHLHRLFLLPSRYVLVLNTWILVVLETNGFRLEQVRLNIPPETPVAVQQWQGLIAVNYPARRLGVKRHSSVTDALKLCPELQLVHVATYTEKSSFDYHVNPERDTHKVSLEPYRRASSQIFEIFRRYSKTVQKASVDEAYIDVTEEVNKLLIERYSGYLNDVYPPKIDWESLGVVLGELDEEVEWNDMQLAIGAEISKTIRARVFEELGYTCSTGIAHNKTLAKLCSALNKPNQQTVIRQSAVLEFLRDMPFRKIRSLGGKLGDLLESQLKAETASDIWEYTVDELTRRFGQGTGLFLYNIVRGIDDEEVVPRNISKSMMAAKSFYPAINALTEAESWINILSIELYTRLQDDFELNGRWPKTLSIHYRSANSPSGRSKSGPMIVRGKLTSPEVLGQKALEYFRSAEQVFPCVGLSITATAFVKDEGRSSKAITSFFTPSPKAATNILPLDDSPKPVSNGISAHSKHTSNSSNSLSAVVESEKREPIAVLPEVAIHHEADIDCEANLPTIDCEKCGKSIPYNEWDEHSDYHFALALSKGQKRPSETHPPKEETASSKKKSTKTGIAKFFK
ncbi:DNA/RNA polymerase [Basidiobolus meristosporus CBS 931.73]|uniref:DNA polymerase eta n=1 Tax=Basidiobolus meristosporus CBS 931.73 TaxID=1314790 RepID=A0A1Y1Y3B9_9FUNG|nr:DNA/RNA polymerase [Basidiobolus meristosporus CBS 931.73]|eukprot:ORX92385.1 DNA/RNA polymerase [Basidiobolus meristosporus CBS 931.73]